LLSFAAAATTANDVHGTTRRINDTNMALLDDDDSFGNIIF
jgi:hypothetical protein